MEQRDSCRGKAVSAEDYKFKDLKIQEQVTSVALPGGCMWVLLHPIHAPVRPSWPMHV